MALVGNKYGFDTGKTPAKCCFKHARNLSLDDLRPPYWVYHDMLKTFIFSILKNRFWRGVGNLENPSTFAVLI
jgi:hypothetical protein